MFLKIVSILLLSIVGGNAQQNFSPVITRPQTIRFFTSTDCTGTTRVDYTTSRNVSADKPTSPYQSYCVLTGAWRVEYAWMSSPYDFNITLGDGCSTCTRSESSRRHFGLIRYLGGSDVTKPSLRLYTERDFGGIEIPVDGYEYSLDVQRSFMSFAFTSYSNWTWTIYNQPRYRGNRTCYRPYSGSEVTLYNPLTVTVGSVRMGCRNAVPPLYKGLGFLFTLILALAIPSIGVIL